MQYYTFDRNSHFSLYTPTKVFFGRGSLTESLLRSSDLLRGTIVVITTPGTEKRGQASNIADVLIDLPNVLNIEIVSGITPNPKIDEINKAIDRALDVRATVVVGLGGGSALDAAKAVAVGAGARSSIDKYFFDGLMPDECTLPIIAIPTTSGSGSEMSKGAILSCPKRGIKSGIRGDALYPRLAIIDSTLVDSLPLRPTTETGFDVLCHAIESYVSQVASPFSRLLSEQAIYLVGENLPLLAQNLSDCDARDAMAYASMIMGINLGNVGTVLPHRMQYPIGAMSDTSHALGLAALYPAWVETAYNAASADFDRIATLLSGKPCSGKAATLESLITFMHGTCGFPRLCDLGISRDDVEQLVSQVTGNVAYDPTKGSDDTIARIYSSALN